MLFNFVQSGIPALAPYCLADRGLRAGRLQRFVDFAQKLGVSIPDSTRTEDRDFRKFVPSGTSPPKGSKSAAEVLYPNNA